MARLIRGLIGCTVAVSGTYVVQIGAMFRSGSVVILGALVTVAGLLILLSAPFVARSWSPPSTGLGQYVSDQMAELKRSERRWRGSSPDA